MYVVCSICMLLLCYALLFFCILFLYSSILYLFIWFFCFGSCYNKMVLYLVLYKNLFHFFLFLLLLLCVLFVSRTYSRSILYIHSPYNTMEWILCVPSRHTSTLEQWKILPLYEKEIHDHWSPSAPLYMCFLILFSQNFKFIIKMLKFMFQMYQNHRKYQQIHIKILYNNSVCMLWFSGRVISSRH